jgi:hypothetical protein
MVSVGVRSLDFSKKPVTWVVGVASQACMLPAACPARKSKMVGRFDFFFLASFFMLPSCSSIVENVGSPNQVTRKDVCR